MNGIKQHQVSWGLSRFSYWAGNIVADIIK